MDTDLHQCAVWVLGEARSLSSRETNISPSHLVGGKNQAVGKPEDFRVGWVPPDLSKQGDVIWSYAEKGRLVRTGFSRRDPVSTTWRMKRNHSVKVQRTFQAERSAAAENHIREGIGRFRKERVQCHLSGVESRMRVWKNQAGRLRPSPTSSADHAKGLDFILMQHKNNAGVKTEQYHHPIAYSLEKEYSSCSLKNNLEDTEAGRPLPHPREE